MVFILYLTIGIIIFMFGASLGSFCSAYIERYQQGVSIVKGRSICPSCHRPIKGYDLIPVLSFIVLEGKCRFCGGRIPWENFVLEVLGGVTALGLFFVYGLTGEGVLYLFVLAALLCIFLIDMRTMDIPHALNIVIFVLGILSGFLFPHISWLDRGIGLVAISVPMFLLTLLVPHAFGGGDVKLMGVAGVLLGWQALLVAFFIGLVIGGAQSVYILRVQKRDKKTLFAFGPALAIGIAISLFFGHNIIDWYIRLLF